MGPEQDYRYFRLRRRAKQIDRFYRLSKECNPADDFPRPSPIRVREGILAEGETLALSYINPLSAGWFCEAHNRQFQEVLQRIRPFGRHLGGSSDKPHPLPSCPAKAGIQSHSIAGDYWIARLRGR